MQTPPNGGLCESAEEADVLDRAGEEAEDADGRHPDADDDHQREE